MDARVLGFALLLATISALLAGLVPALQASRRKIVDHLREGAREGTGAGEPSHAQRARGRGSRAGADPPDRRRAADPHAVDDAAGASAASRPEHVAMMTVSLPATDVSRSRRTCRRSTRGSSSACARCRASSPRRRGTGVLQPLVTNSGIFSHRRQAAAAAGTAHRVSGRNRLAGLLRDGRHDDRRAAAGSPTPTTRTRRAWSSSTKRSRARPGPGQDPHRPPHARPATSTSQAPWMTVVGVIRDAHRAEVTRAIRPESTLGTLQATPRTQTLFVATAGDPTPSCRRFAASCRRSIRSCRSSTSRRSNANSALTLTQPRFQAVLLAVFALDRAAARDDRHLRRHRRTR